MNNLFENTAAAASEELFTEILRRPGVRVERIVSTGQTTPPDAPHNQDHDEWVLLISGAARLWIEHEGDRSLLPGDHLLIPAHHCHRVTWTMPDKPSIWLALHFEAHES